MAEQGINGEELLGNGEIPIFEKYDDHIPVDLLRRAYAVDKLDTQEAANRLLQILEEY